MEKETGASGREQASSGNLPLLKDKFFWLGLAAAGLILSFTLWFSMGPDAGIFSYCSWVWDKFHEPPYVGCVKHDFPGIFLIHWLELKIFGTSVPGFRFFNFLVELASAMMILHIARKLFKSGLAGFFAALAFVVYYFNLDWGFTAEREAFILFLTLAAMIVQAALHKNNFASAALTGLMAGFCFLIKPTAVLLWPAFAAFYWMDKQALPRRPWAEILIFLLACLAPSAIVVLAYARSGHLDQMVQMIYLLAFKVYPKLPLLVEPDRGGGRFAISRPMLVGYLAYKTIRDNPVVCLAAVPAVMSVVSAGREFKDRKLFWMVLVLAAAGLIPVFIPRRFNDYHRMPFQGMLVVLAGGGFNWMIQKAAQSIKFSRQGLVRLLFGIVISGIILCNVQPRLIMFAGKYAYRAFKPAHAFQTPYEEGVVDYLRPLLGPGDQVCYFGTFSALPFLLGKKLTSPFPHIFPMIWQFDNRGLAALQQQWKQEYIAAFLKNRPRFFIFDQRYSINYYNLPVPTAILSQEFSPIKKSLDEDYVVSAKFGPIFIYELKSESRPSSP